LENGIGMVVLGTKLIGGWRNGTRRLCCCDDVKVRDRDNAMNAESV